MNFFEKKLLNKVINVYSFRNNLKELEYKESKNYKKNYNFIIKQTLRITVVKLYFVKYPKNDLKIELILENGIKICDCDYRNLEFRI